MRSRGGQPNLFEAAIKGLLEDRNLQVAAFVCEYDHDRCLLSDRGFSQPLPDGAHMAFSFNLCATAFIHYIFADPGTLLQGRGSPEFLDHALACWRTRPQQPTIDIRYLTNNRGMLARYNRRVVEQCHERVYCSVKDDLVLFE
jgi:hypothetical protein